MEKKHVLRKVAFGAAIAAVIGAAACAAPMEVDVEVGRSLTVTYAETESAPKPPEVMKALEGSVKLDNVRVRGHHEGGEITLQIEAWGEDLGDEPLADKLREAMPALASAKITERPLSGKVDSTLGKKIGHALFNINVTDDQDVEVVRQKILEQLAAQGVEGSQVKVDVQGDGKGEGRRVNIEIRREDEARPPEEAEEKKAAP